MPFEADIDLILDNVRCRHLGYLPKPLPIPSLRDLEASFARARDLLGTAESIEYFYLQATALLSPMGDAHTFLSQPSSDEWGSRLPVTLAWFREGLYISDVAPGIDPSLRYLRVVSINGVAAERLDTQASKHVCADRRNAGYIRRFLGGTPNLLVRRAFLLANGGPPDAAELLFEMEQGGRAVRLPFGMQAPASPVPCRNTITAVRDGNRWEYLPKYKAVYLQLNDLPYLSIDHKYFQEAFDTAHRECVRHLILDLRNNRGGWARWLDVLLSYLVNRKRRVLLFRGWRRHRRVNIPYGDGTRIIHPVKDFPPFDGRVFALVGPNTFSSGTWFAVALKDNGLGTLLGENCGSNSFRYGHTYNIELPQSKLRFLSSKRIWERAARGQAAREYFICPNRTIVETVTDLRAQQDPCWDYLERSL